VAEFLFIRLADDAATWGAFDASGRLLTSVARGPLAAARQAAEGRRVVVLVPAIDVIAAQAELPAGSQSRLRQVLPYSLEDAVADDIEQLAFAVGPRSPSGAVSAAIVAKQRLERWLSELSASGLTPHAIYSEAEGVPDVPGALTLLIEGSKVYGRRAGQPPFVLEGLGVARVVAMLSGADEAQDLERVIVYTDQGGRAEQQAGLAEIKDTVPQVEVKVAVDGLFPRLAATLAQRPGTNLLQGAYAPKSNWSALARPWRTAAMLLATAGLLAFLGQVVEYVALRREDGALAELVAATCERVVATTRMASCESEVQRRLREAGAAETGTADGFLTTLAAVAAARDPDTRIDALNYRNRVMDLRLIAASVPALDQFAREIEQTQRFATKMESTSQSDAGVEGRIQITGVDR
jgi:general secretion pathway protein L